MEIKSKLIERISLDTEILSTLPKNNKKNADACLIELEKTHLRYDEIRNSIVNELQKRQQKHQDLKPSEEVSILKKRMIELEYKVTMLNPYNSPYEKMGLDRIIYDISKYYKNNLIKVNTDILLAINVFKKVGIFLTKEDFSYTSYAKEYMGVYFEEINDLSSDKLKHSFEKIYWKKPNVIKHIQLNFRQLYYKHLESFEKFCTDEERSFNKSVLVNMNSACEDYISYSLKLEQVNNESDYLFLKKFSDKELDINNFAVKKIFDLYKVYTDATEIDEHINTSVIKFNKTINEYKNYYKFQFISDNVKEIFNVKDKDKEAVSKKKIAEIKKLETSLNSDKSKNAFSRLFKSKKIDIDKTIDDLMNLYSELDELIFREKVLEFINEDSKISDLLELASSYFIYISRLLKNKNPDILDESIYEIVDSLKVYLIKEHKLISNLNAFAEHDMAMIISDKYKLDNLKVSMDMLKQENLDNLINQTNQLITYYHISKLKNISIADIEEYLKITKKLLEINAK